MNTRKLKIYFAVILLIAVLFSPIVFSLISRVTVTIPSEGQLVGVDTVGEGIECEPKTISWGTFYVGGSVFKSVEIFNNGTSPNMLLFNTTALPNYLTLSWDINGSILQPMNRTVGWFTLRASSTAPATSFAFNITVIGEPNF